MARAKLWHENMSGRFPKGTFKAIAAVLKPGEDRTDFVRTAVERELKRRAKAEKKPKRR
jgi:hypothetical protein